jgi:hypothetical protein
MSGCTKWYHVWRGNRIDELFENVVSAKKHAAWLHHNCGKPNQWFRRVSVTLNGEDIPFDDYEFKNGDSRKIRKTV